MRGGVGSGRSNPEGLEREGHVGRGWGESVQAGEEMPELSKEAFGGRLVGEVFGPDVPPLWCVGVGSLGGSGGSL